jgi:hypothetical protein
MSSTAKMVPVSGRASSLGSRLHASRAPFVAVTGISLAGLTYISAAGRPLASGWSGYQCVMPHRPRWRDVILRRLVHVAMPGWRSRGSSADCGFSRRVCTDLRVALFPVSSTSSSLSPSSRCHGRPATRRVTVDSATRIHGWFQ